MRNAPEVEAIRTAAIARGEAVGVHGLTSAKRSGRSGSLADTEEGDDTDVVEEGLRLTRAITECAVAAKGRKGSRAEMAVVRAQVCGGTGGAHVSTSYVG